MEDQTLFDLIAMEDEKKRPKFVLCVRNEGSDDLELRKVYQVLPDPEALGEHYVRVIDDSGEDYLYPGDYFVPVRLPIGIESSLTLPSNMALRKTAHRRAAPVGSPRRQRSK